MLTSIRVLRPCILAVVVAPLALFASLAALAAPALAATVSTQDGTLRVSAGPGEVNAITVSAEAPPAGAPILAVADEGSPPSAGAGCLRALTSGRVTCAATGVTAVEVDAGDGADGVAFVGPLAARLRGGDGDDVLVSGGGADLLDGGAGNDLLGGNAGNDAVLGGLGDDSLHGGEGADGLDGDRGRDSADGGGGDDSVLMRDAGADSVVCGLGRDRVRAEVLDSLDFSCEQVDYGRPGRAGRLLARIGGGRFVPVPGQGGARVDRRILPGVLYMIRRYRVRIGDGYSLSRAHTPYGEHPLGLAVDIYPGPGGSWTQVDRLARWAEPRQNRPRPPFRWVGYNGDHNHGRGNHLHLSWQHSKGRFGRPVRKVWVFAVSRGRAVTSSLRGSPFAVPAGYPRELGRPDR